MTLVIVGIAGAVGRALIVESAKELEIQVVSTKFLTYKV
jgi:hypothetical protein